ncbi:hypothetical protein [Pantoea stewartii]|uniref:hypothetical protein n=1 Tax=Pantoea stewartii TaxID=66269 RepID=UPI00345C57F9
MTGKTAGRQKTASEIFTLVPGLIFMFFRFFGFKTGADLSVLVLKSGEVATGDGSVRAEPGTVV